MDKIILNQLTFYGFHGVFPEEKRLGQPFIVDAELYVPLKEAGETDDMTKSIDYGAAFDVIQQVVEGKSKNLIETVAEEAAAVLFRHFPLLEACTIKVIKPHPPISGHYKSVAVEISRKRN